MTSYGGYTRTGYGAQGGDDGGGFMGASQQASQSTSKRNYADEKLRPVTVKQLVDCKEAYPGADLTLDGVAVTQVTLVGQVRAVNPQAINVTYRIDDGTGVVDVKKWIDADKPDDDGLAERFALDTYVRVFGRLNTFDGRKHVGAHSIRAIDDFNEVNYHMLEATYVHLYLAKKGLQAGGQQQHHHQQQQQQGQGGDSMFVDSGMGAPGGGGGPVGAKLASCSRNALSMFNHLGNSAGGDDGLNIYTLASGMGLSVRDVQAAADELLSHGLIYTTADDVTWAILDY